MNGAAEEEPQRGGPTRAKAFLVSISAKPDRPGDALPLDNALAENTKALIEDAPERIRKGLGVSFCDPRSRAPLASTSAGRSIQLTYEGRPLDQAPAQVLDWLHDNAEQYGLRFPYETDPSSTRRGVRTWWQHSCCGAGRGCSAQSNAALFAGNDKGAAD